MWAGQDRPDGQTRLGGQRWRITRCQRLPSADRPCRHVDETFYCRLRKWHRTRSAHQLSWRGHMAALATAGELDYQRSYLTRSSRGLRLFGLG